MEAGEKRLQVEHLSEQFGSSIVALCADYRGLTVEQMTGLRRGLKEKGSVGHVVKNTLARISIKQALGSDQADSKKQQESEKLANVFTGPSFVVFSKEDPVAPAKVLAEFAKSHEALQIKGGWFEGNFIDAEAVKNLSNMPSREELYSKLLSVLVAPATKLVRTLNEPAARLVRLLEAYRAKREGES